MQRALSLVVSLAACSGPQAPITGERARETWVPDAPPPAAPAPSTVPSAATASPSASAVAAAPRARTTPFPPAPRTPPHERTTKPGDGAWTLLPASAAGSPLARTRIHPHKIRPDVEVDVVAIDLSRARLGFVLGTEEPESDAIAKDARPGTLPQADVDELLAAMNGGFKRRHGEHGAIAGGVVVVPPKPDVCSLVSRGGEIQIGTHKHLALGEATSIDFLRQGPPCLVEGGAKHPDTTGEYSAKKWGSAEDGKREIRRSAFGLSADRETLYFAIGDWVTAEWFADALVAAGVEAACQLDINWSYTRFVLYEHTGGEPVASSPLLEKLKFSRTEYWKTPSLRDFFYLARR